MAKVARMGERDERKLSWKEEDIYLYLDGRRGEVKRNDGGNENDNVRERSRKK